MKPIQLAIAVGLMSVNARAQDVGIRDRLSDATVVLVGTVDHVDFRYDSSDYPTALVTVTVSNTILGAPSDTLLVTVKGGPSKDGSGRVYHDSVNYSLLSAGVKGLFAVRLSETKGEYVLIDDKLTVFTRAHGVTAGSCGLTANNGILLDPHSMKLDPHPPFPIRPGSVNFPTSGPKVARVDCHGAPSWEDIVEIVENEFTFVGPMN